MPPEETEAEDLRQGAAMAVRWAGQQGHVELVIRGRPGQWGDDGVEAGRMVLDDGVIGIIAPPGGIPSHLALQVAGRTATPLISLCGDSSVTGAGVPWSVRIVPRTVDEAGAILTAFAGTHSRWAALVPDQRAGREIAQDLAQAADGANCRLDPIIAVERDLADFSRLGIRLPQPWPDGLLLWLDTEPASLAARSLRAAGFVGTLAGPGRLYSERFPESAGSALEGFVIARPRVDPAAAQLAERFAAEYSTTYGGSPGQTAAMACDAVSLLMRLVRQEGASDLHRHFPIACGFVGVTGPLRFDERGNRLVDLELVEFTTGKWSPLARRSR